MQFEPKFRWFNQNRWSQLNNLHCFNDICLLVKHLDLFIPTQVLCYILNLANRIQSERFSKYLLNNALSECIRFLAVHNFTLYRSSVQIYMADGASCNACTLRSWRGRIAGLVSACAVCRGGAGRGGAGRYAANLHGAARRRHRAQQCSAGPETRRVLLR